MERVSQSPALEQFETFDIVNLVREQLTNTASRAYKQDVELSLTGVEEATYIKGNPVLMGEAFDNLIDNALRYGCSSKGKIETRIQTKNNQVTITVADNGTGISEGLLPDVFERFTRGAEDGSDGCGLGLAIARSIVQKHNGELHLSSSKKGTEATISLHLS